MKLTAEFQEYLYNYWLENNENICTVCTNNIICTEENCDQFEKYDKTTFWGHQMTCMDLDFAMCPKMKDSPCATCNCINNFNWNGVVPTDLDLIKVEN